jgi:hypothetical protein
LKRRLEERHKEAILLSYPLLAMPHKKGYRGVGVGREEHSGFKIQSYDFILEIRLGSTAIRVKDQSGSCYRSLAQFVNGRASALTYS